MHQRDSQVLCSASLAAAAILLVSGCGSGSAPPPTVRAVEMGDYEVVLDWPKPLPDDDLSHDGWTWGSGAGAFPESPDKVWIAQRGEIELPPGAEPWVCACLLEPRRTNTGRRAYSDNEYFYDMRRHHIVFAVDSEGYAIEEWLQHDAYFTPPRGSGLGEIGRGPHKILQNPYDPERHIWIVDDDQHIISIFTNDGDLVKVMGERGVPGQGPNNFNRPTDIAWLPDGTFFVADGYVGTRVAKFDPDGNFIMDWGSAPADPDNPGPSEFNNPHSIAISADRRLFVIDRGNERMQVFDENGNFLDMWPLRSPHWPESQNTLLANHFIDTDGYIWVSNAPTSRFMKFDQDGNYLYGWGAPGMEAGRLACSHGITTDQDGNLYIADCFAGRVQKFEPIPGADPSKMAGQILREYPVN